MCIYSAGGAPVEEDEDDEDVDEEEVEDVDELVDEELELVLDDDVLDVDVEEVDELEDDELELVLDEDVLEVEVLDVDELEDELLELDDEVELELDVVVVVVVVGYVVEDDELDDDVDDVDVLDDELEVVVVVAPLKPPNIVHSLGSFQKRNGSVYNSLASLTVRQRLHINDMPIAPSQSLVPELFAPIATLSVLVKS